MGNDLVQENTQLKQELAQRDLLIQQLSEELFRLVKGNIGFVPNPTSLAEYEMSVQILTEKITILEAELLEARGEVVARENLIVSLRRQIHELQDRQRQLEQVLAEQPKIYRAKFAERMIPIKQKIEQLQKENRQLHMELQSLSFCLASRHIASPYQLPPLSSVSLSSRN
ncbi:MAG: Npun_F5560 family protein [Pseudanabaenaceae cyanobacterium]